MNDEVEHPITSGTPDTGVATKDSAKQAKAVNDLVGYRQDFAAFLAPANPPSEVGGQQPGVVNVWRLPR
jgi:hypothetical protein